MPFYKSILKESQLYGIAQAPWLDPIKIKRTKDANPTLRGITRKKVKA